MISPIYFQLNHKKNNNKNKFLTATQETNITDKIDDKTKSIVNQQHQNENNQIIRNNYFLKRYENYFHKKLVIKYNVLPHEYNLMQLDNFITAKYCHSLASFKEQLIYNENEEFLKRYSKIDDSVNKIPLLSKFYKSYLHFFCFPTFAELRLNDLFEDLVEDKAKAFYNENYKEENIENKDNKNSNKIINTTIFTKKIRQNISRKNTLIDLSITTINNSISNKNSLNSIKTINRIMELFDNKTDKNSLTFKNENKNLNLLKEKEKQDSSDKKDYIKEKMKKIDLYNILIPNENNCITDRNYSKINNNNKNIKFIKSIEKRIKTNKNNKNNLINVIKNQYITNKLNANIKFDKKKKNSLNKNNKNMRKSSKINNFCNNMNKNEESKMPKIYKKSVSKKINKVLNIVNIMTKDTGNNTDRERRNYIPKIKKIHNKGLLDNKIHTFLKIALNFSKSPPKKRTTILFKKIYNKDSKTLLTDRNKNNSYKIKNKINKISCMNSNLTECNSLNKKNSLNSLGSKSKQLYHLSRNYKPGFEDIKTIIIKTSLQKSRLKETYKNNGYNSSKKKLVPCLRFKNINKISSSKNKTQISLKSRDNTNSLVKKEISYLSNINLSHLHSKGKKNKESNFKTINMKKSFLPLNRLVTTTLGLSNNNNLKRQTNLNKINIPNI